eukprot:PITA_35433
MQLKSAKEIWDKIVLSYEGDEQVKRAKLKTLRIQYESLRMHNDESVASYFLRIDEIVNCMKNLGEEIKEVIVVEKVLRSLSPKFDSKVSAIEEKKNLQNLTISQLHRILTAYEMRKGGPLDRREAAFKASGKGDYYESGHMSEEEEESNFAKNLQRGTGRFKGKLPFKCFACGRVGHYAAKCPHKDKLNKGKEPVRWNRKQNVNKKRYYTHEDSDGLSNNDEDEKGNDNRLLMDFEDDDFLDAINEEGIYEEISKLKVCLKEKNMIIDTLTFQLAKKDRHNEELECENVGLRKNIEKTKVLNLRFAKGSETLDEIIKVQHSPLIKTCLGYSKEASQGDKEKLQPYTTLEREKKVSFGDDTPAFIKGKCSARLKKKVKARNVMYVDGLKHNILSVNQMCDQGTEIRKTCKYQVFRDLLDIRIPDNTICKSCQFGKKTKTNFPKKEGLASRPLELVHTDICGPTRKRSPRGEEYFIFFIEDFSRMCWIGLMKYKDEAFKKFKSLKALVENESDPRIKCLRSDRGGEFTFDEFFDFCEEHGI